MTSRPRKKPGASAGAARSAATSAPPAGPPAAPADPRLPLLTGAVALSAAIVVVASFFPAARLWGVNHLAFVPPAARIAAIALLALAFVPAVARAAYRGAIRGFESLGTMPRPGARALALVAAVAAVGLFWTARSATLLLGDGQLLVRSFEAAEEGHDRVVMRSAKAIVTEEKIAPGATLLYYGANKLSTDRFKKTPLAGMRALNCVLGGLFVWLVFALAAGRFAGAETRLWLAKLALFACSIELFFGYIENYTAILLLLSLYVVAAFRALHRRGSTWLPAVPLALAIYAHIQCVLFVPSYVYLLLWVHARPRRAALLRYWMPLFTGAALIAVIVAAGNATVRKFYVPLGFDNDRYALLSPHHLLDVANELFMLLPILPVVAAMAWVGRRAERAAGVSARDARFSKDPSSWFSHPCEWQMSGTILVACAVYLALFHPEIGMARDWDLFTMATAAIVPMTLLVLGRYTRVTGLSGDALARVATPALALVMVTGAAWVAVNASVPRTVDRFERILTYDRTHASYAWENLAMLHHERGDLERAISTMQTAVDHSRNPRQYVRLAVYLEEAGRVDEAKQVLRDVLARRPEFTKARFRLVMFLEKEEAWGEILEVARGGIEHSPEEPIYHFFYGEALMRAGRMDEGLAIFRECSRLKLPESIQQHVTRTLERYDGKPAR